MINSRIGKGITAYKIKSEVGELNGRDKYPGYHESDSQ